MEQVPGRTFPAAGSRLSPTFPLFGQEESVSFAFPYPIEEAPTLHLLFNGSPALKSQCIAGGEGNPSTASLYELVRAAL